MACAGTPPIKEYNLSRAALKYAKKYKSKRYAPAPYRKAIALYKEGKVHFKGRYYSSAEEAFEESRQFAEKAEEFSRWKLYTEGDFSL